MKNFIQFLSGKSNVCNGERLAYIACIVFLASIRLRLNEKLFETRIALLDRQKELEKLQEKYDKQNELDNLQKTYDERKLVVIKCNERKKTTAR